MARQETLQACKVSKEGKRYLDKSKFEELSVIEKFEAVLWLFWPRELSSTKIFKVAKLKSGGYYTRVLLNENRIVQVKRGIYRFKPQK